MLSRVAALQRGANIPSRGPRLTSGFKQPTFNEQNEHFHKGGAISFAPQRLPIRVDIPALPAPCLSKAIQQPPTVGTGLPVNPRIKSRDGQTTRRVSLNRNTA